MLGGFYLGQNYGGQGYAGPQGADPDALVVGMMAFWAGGSVADKPPHPAFFSLFAFWLGGSYEPSEAVVWWKQHFIIQRARQGP